MEFNPSCLKGAAGLRRFYYFERGMALRAAITDCRQAAYTMARPGVGDQIFSEFIHRCVAASA